MKQISCGAKNHYYIVLNFSSNACEEDDIVVDLKLQQINLPLHLNKCHFRFWMKVLWKKWIFIVDHFIIISKNKSNIVVAAFVKIEQQQQSYVHIGLNLNGMERKKNMK